MAVRTGTCQRCDGAVASGGRGAVPRFCETCRKARHAEYVRARNVHVKQVRTCQGCGKTYDAPGRDTNSIHCKACRPAARSAALVARNREYRKPRSTGGRQRATPAVTHRCLVCDGTPETVEWRSGTRRWCSGAHERLWYKHEGQIPDGFACVECQAWVTYDAGGGKRLRSDSKLCRDCAKVTTYEVTAWDLAKRDGNDCRLCGDPVDLSLRFPEQWSPSADHIIPQSQGGGHHAGNLQLAHWICNVRRKDRPLGKGVTVNG